jgi:carbamoyl-phosphate synthase large subunit
MVKVLVTGAGGGIGLSIIKALNLAPERYRITGADANPLAVGLRAGVDGGVVLPPANGHGYIDALRVTASTHDVLIPGSDAELKAIAAGKERIEQDSRCKVLVSPWWSVRKMRDKLIAADWLKLRGFAHPRTSSMFGHGGMHSPVGFPFVVKPVSGSGSVDTHVICEEDVHWPRRPGVRYFCQEYLEGPEFTTSVMVGFNGVPYDMVTLVRLAPKLGPGHQMIARETADPTSMQNQQLWTIAQRLKTLGCCNIQWKERNGQVVPFEINMRFPGSTIICAVAGMNGPHLAIQDLLNDERPVAPHQHVRCLRHLDEVFQTQWETFKLEGLSCSPNSPAKVGCL